MTVKQVLQSNLDKIHTTPLGEERIRKNLDLKQKDVLAYCKACIQDESAKVEQKGKNDYCECGDVVLTINVFSYTVITAHPKTCDKIKSSKTDASIDETVKDSRKGEK